jgi:hypothetical protein
MDRLGAFLCCVFLAQRQWVDAELASSSRQLSTPKDEIGAPGARYAATFGRLETTS